MNSTTRTQLATLLSNVKLEDISEVYDIVKETSRRLEFTKSLIFNVGDVVEFEDRRGRKIKGTITKINSSRIKVNVQGMQWSVSPSFLRKLAKSLEERKGEFKWVLMQLFICQRM